MISLDYLNLVFSEDTQEFRDVLRFYFQDKYGEAPQSYHGGLHGYEESIRFSPGLIIAWGGENQRGTLLVSLSGRAVAPLGWYGVASFLRQMVKEFRSLRVKCTRADVAIDIRGDLWKDFNKSVFTRIDEKRVDVIRTINTWRRDSVPDHDGNLMGKRDRFGLFDGTIYVGGRESPRMMRCYAKIIRDAHWSRFEMEARDGYAAGVLSLLLGGGSLTSAAILVFEKYVRLDDYFQLHNQFEWPCEVVRRVRIRKRSKWIKAIGGALAEYADEFPMAFEHALFDGALKVGVAPYGNTGVHFDEVPEWLDAVSDISLQWESSTGQFYGFPDKSASQPKIQPHYYPNGIDLHLTRPDLFAELPGYKI
jgi:hypothetical protein